MDGRAIYPKNIYSEKFLRMKKHVIGIDIGGTFTKFGFVCADGELTQQGSIPTDKYPIIEDFLGELCGKIQKIIDKENFEILGIGVGAPNGNFYTGKIEFAPNLLWKGVVDLHGLLKKHFNVPVAVTNDANAAALGELIYGGGKGMKDFIMVTLGTGLGSGFVVNGNVVYGHDGFAGELGHTVAVIDGRQCACGKKGCLETYVSASGIKRTMYKMIASEIEPSELRSVSFNDLDAKMISNAARKGDSLALKAFDYTGKMLGLKLADAVAHTSPEAIFLFGGLSCAGDLIFEPTKKYMEHFLLPIYRNKIKLLPSALQDKNIAVLGAGALIWNEIKNQRIQG
jgi:glucokinase